MCPARADSSVAVSSTSPSPSRSRPEARSGSTQLARQFATLRHRVQAVQANQFRNCAERSSFSQFRSGQTKRERSSRHERCTQILSIVATGLCNGVSDTPMCRVSSRYRRQHADRKRCYPHRILPDSAGVRNDGHCPTVSLARNGRRHRVRRSGRDHRVYQSLQALLHGHGAACGVLR